MRSPSTLTPTYRTTIYFVIQRYSIISASQFQITRANIAFLASLFLILFVEEFIEEMCVNDYY